MPKHFAAKVDDNQKNIVKILRRSGAFVLSIAMVKNAFDLVVAYRGKVYCMEVKDGSKQPSSRKLSDGEIHAARKLEATGVTYHVVKSAEEALKTILTGEDQTDEFYREQKQLKL